MTECILIRSKWSIRGSHVWGYVLGLIPINFTAKRLQILISRAQKWQNKVVLESEKEPGKEFKKDRALLFCIDIDESAVFYSYLPYRYE